MFPKATRKKPPHTTQHTTVLAHSSDAPGEQFTPMLPAGEWSFLSARHSRASWSLLATPGQSCSCSTSPEQRSRRHRGPGGYQGRHKMNVLLTSRGVGTFKGNCLLAHVSRKDTFLPEGNDPHRRRDYNIAQTHTLLSKAQTQEPQITWQPVKTTRWETYMASPAALRRLCIWGGGGGNRIKPNQKMKYCKDS